MGDAGEPVTIYFWDSARGAARMQAEGRGTTKRTGESFPAQATYRDGAWHLTMELDSIPSGMPLAFAVWNGSQQDRDGRKYFTTWLKLE
jgi:complex iron-sulfur molybdoenzyme family reductase subunit gamma